MTNSKTTLIPIASLTTHPLQRSSYGDEPGDIKQWLGVVHCGNCVELMEKMPAGSVDLILTSPPYNLRNSTGNGMKDGRGSKWKSAQLRDGYDEYADNMPREEYVAWQRRCLTSMMRLLSATGAIFYNHKQRVQGGLMEDPHDIVAGFPVRQMITWLRNGGINFNRGYFLPNTELIYLICKPKFRLAPGANKSGVVWHIAQERKNPHPAPFPLALARRCIESTTAKIVLDPFLGSGTTAIAAEIYGRAWIGLEISKNYCEMSRRRIEVSRRSN